MNCEDSMRKYIDRPYVNVKSKFSIILLVDKY